MNQGRGKGKKVSRLDFTRRDFHKLTVAAFGGMVGGLSLGRSAMAFGGGEESLLLKEPHVCCGLNTCKGHGTGGNNECAGMGSCATVEHHSCKGEEGCSGQGGCGAKPGENGCKGQGSCAVPLKADHGAPKSARANFEAAMKKAGKKFGPAPESCS